MHSKDYVNAAKTMSLNEYAGATPCGESLKGDLEEQQLLIPNGILGFPESCHYRLERYRPEDGGESPFLTIKCLNEDLSFALISPNTLGLDYRVPVSNMMLDALSATSTEKLLALLIVTLRERIEDITVNLQGPLVINPASSLGLQLVIENYPVRYPLIHG